MMMRIWSPEVIIRENSGNQQFVIDKAIKRIMLLGDVHGGWASLTKLIKKERPELIIQLGDFGYFPRSDFFGYGDTSSINLMGANIVFCGGNHEDWYSLNEIARSNRLEISPGIFYAPRCSTMVLPDERKILFMGGAASIDRNVRIEGVDWFREEIILEGVMYRLPDINIDVLACHTTPLEFLPIKDSFEFPDPSRGILSEIVKKYSPPNLYCAHWHVKREYFHKETLTKMICLCDLYDGTLGGDSWCWLGD